MNLLKKLSIFKSKKFWLILIILLIVGVFIFQKQNAKKPLPELGQVTQGSIRVEVSTSGILTGSASASLHFKGTGKLAELDVKQGQMVQKNDQIAALDTQDLSIALNQAQNNLSSAQATTQKVIDDIHLSQYGNGGFSNVGSNNETETQRQARMNAESTSNDAYDSVKAAERNFQDAIIISPIAGVVTNTNLQPGQIVSPTDIIAKVVDFGTIVFEADVDESDIGQVKLGQKTEVTLNAYGDQIFTGQVVEILPVTHTTSNGATAITVKIKLDDQSISKIDGLNGQATIITAQKDQVLIIPQEALLDDNTVMVQTPGGYKSVKVTTGLKSDTDVEITSGLSNGQTIVQNPSVLESPKPSKG